MHASKFRLSLPRNRWDLLSLTIDKGIYEARWTALRKEMKRKDIGALIVASEPELHYLTGFRPPLFVSSARPWFAVLGLDGRAVLGVARLAEREALAAPSMPAVETWTSPAPHEGRDVLFDLISRCGGEGAIACALGDHTRLGLPAGWLNDLRTRFNNTTLVDSSDVLWPLRLIKTEEEIRLITEAAQIAQIGFDAVAKALRPGLAETDIACIFSVAALEAGAEDVCYLAVGSGSGGYASIIDRPSRRALSPGDIVGLDAGVRVGGYWCDYNRNFAIGASSADTMRAGSALGQAARHAAIFCRAGVRASEIWDVMVRSLETSGYHGPHIGRMGHGVGLEFTEHPYIAAHDHTIIMPGMVMSIEPTLSMDSQRIMTYEDMVVVTDNGARLLTKPVVGGLTVIAG